MGRRYEFDPGEQPEGGFPGQGLRIVQCSDVHLDRRPDWDVLEMQFRVVGDVDRGTTFRQWISLKPEMKWKLLQFTHALQVDPKKRSPEYPQGFDPWSLESCQRHLVDQCMVAIIVHKPKYDGDGVFLNVRNLRALDEAEKQQLVEIWGSYPPDLPGQSVGRPLHGQSVTQSTYESANGFDDGFYGDEDGPF